ncbi:MAG: hypothetical protein K6T90_19620 [Leptolyngbyaceae cyanobacterium HOT.MB2.61]|nr:hypothetical protein [Leptolyngbyaceae cyanobacterium HOT.MB2.61]
MTSSHTIAHPLPARQPAHRRERRQRNNARFEANRWVLLMQAGWVAVGLIAIASFPDVKSPAANPSALPQTALTYPLKATAIVADPALLFANGPESIVARTIGHAEGTRAPDGTRTPAYFGHTDPGNGVWNLGSFSFQHCREPRYRCSTPEQADAFQLQRLKTQADDLRQRSLTLNLKINLEEELNAIDLANQAPLAALGKPGYPDYLQQVKNQGKKGQDAILEARVWSFWNPETNRWDAPGLGNTEAGIRHDQKRRMLAIARVLAIYQPQTVAQSPQKYANWLSSNKHALANPYSFQTQRTQYLWWDAGYWDAKLERGRQIPEGFEATYDEGFRRGLLR